MFSVALVTIRSARNPIPKSISGHESSCHENTHVKANDLVYTCSSHGPA